jgi:hypothetical protein
MNSTEQNILKLGSKVLEDIGYDSFWDKTDEEGPRATFIDKDKKLSFEEEHWLVSFPYGKEDYGENVRYIITINDFSEKAINISYRNGFIKLGYDEEKDKYFIAEKR